MNIAYFTLVNLEILTVEERWFLFWHCYLRADWRGESVTKKNVAVIIHMHFRWWYMEQVLKLLDQQTLLYKLEQKLAARLHHKNEKLPSQREWNAIYRNIILYIFLKRWSTVIKILLEQRKFQGKSWFSQKLKNCIAKNDFRVMSIFKIIIRNCKKNVEFCGKTSKFLPKNCLFIFYIFIFNTLNACVALI